MRADETVYRCGVCNKTLFENIQANPLFACPECRTHFIRDPIGIKVAREPPDEWKRRNKYSWESAKRIIRSGYIEIFDC